MKADYRSDVTAPETRKLKIALVGAGNVATHFGKAFKDNGYIVAQVYSRTEDSAKQLADMLGVSYTVDLDQMVRDADIYLVSVKDSAMESLLPQVARLNPDALFLHTAGSVDMDVWKGLARRYGVVYPLQTLSKARPVDFRNVPCLVEANNDADLKLLLSIDKQLTGKELQADSEMRRTLHLAAVFACNFTNHMYAICDYLFKKDGRIPFSVVLPLIDETARKVHQLTPDEAQTGPARRYDENIINKHLDMLKDEPELAKIYELVSRDIHLRTKC